VTGEPHLLPVATPARTRAAVVELLAPARRTIGGATVALVLATGVSLLVAPLFGRLIDRIVDGSDAGDLAGPVALLAGLALAQALLTVAGSALLARVGEEALADLRERFVRRALDLPLARIEAGGSGDLVSRIGQDVAAIGYAAREAIPQMANAVLLMGLTLVALVALDWRFVLVAVLVAPLQVHAARWYLRASGPLYAELRRAGGDLEAQVLETVAEAETVRALRLAPAQLERSRERIERCNQLSFDAAELETRFWGRLNLAEVLGLVTVLVAGALMVDGGQITVGTASAAALYLVALFRPVRTALMQLDPVQSATAGLARVVGVTDLADEPAADLGPATSGAEAAVELRGVGFAYDDGPAALDGVDLVVARGTTVAVVGASGAGKSTLAKLVAGIHAPDRGTIALAPDGRARAVVLVTQEVHVFAGPLAEDLRLVAPDAADDDLLAALAVVGARGWAEALPDGLATVVGEAGHRLTPVQAQQLALARVVLADPAVAILDEATAEAGSAGATVLDASARAALAGRTGLVVAHRLTQAVGADRVVVVDDGRVVQVGPHDDLVAVDGPYARLWSAWQSRAEVAP
jgi:ATP-binding cassette subfamily C protein